MYVPLNVPEVPLAAHGPAGLTSRWAAGPAQPSAWHTSRASSQSAISPIPCPWHHAMTTCARRHVRTRKAVQPLDMHVREPLHVGYRASACADWLGLFAPPYDFSRINASINLICARARPRAHVRLRGGGYCGAINFLDDADTVLSSPTTCASRAFRRRRPHCG